MWGDGSLPLPLANLSNRNFGGLTDHCFSLEPCYTYQVGCCVWGFAGGILAAVVSSRRCVHRYMQMLSFWFFLTKLLECISGWRDLVAVLLIVRWLWEIIKWWKYLRRINKRRFKDVCIMAFCIVCFWRRIFQAVACFTSVLLCLEFRVLVKFVFTLGNTYEPTGK